MIFWSSFFCFQQNSRGDFLQISKESISPVDITESFEKSQFQSKENTGFLSLFTIDNIFFVAFYCTVRYQLKQNNYHVSLSSYEGITLLERRH